MTSRERLFALEQFGIKLGLDNIKALLASLNHPERACPAVHIAGTNGKGSTAAMVERGLRAAGHRTGLYTSPHLAAIEERVAIDGRPLDPAMFDTVTTDVLGAMDRLLETGGLPHPATFFEATTAIAFETFRRLEVTAAVIEVGLGGRFDATNVIQPAVAAITSIAFDHERHLGRTLGQIAKEKAGIIKGGAPVVAGAMPAEAAAVIVEAAARAGAQLTWADAADAGEPVMLALPGAHQRQNAAVAVEVLQRCGPIGRVVHRDHIVTALTDAEWPARLEWLRTTHGDVLIDAAHNPAGAQALAEYVIATTGPLPMVLGAMHDKDVGGIARALAPAAARFVTTTALSARALAAHALAAAIRDAVPSTRVDAIDPPAAALWQALEDQGRAGAGGSIFLVGPLRAELLAGGAVRVRYPSRTTPFFLP